MDELEQQLKNILENPGELQRLASMAQGLLGGDTGGGGGEAPPSAAPAKGAGALIDALAPYLGEKRRSKLRRAASLARAAHLAEKLLAEQGDAP